MPFIQEFNVLPLRYSEESSSSPHLVVCFKEHLSPQHDANRPSGRTLLVLNVPPYANETGLANAFSAAGKIQSVLITKTAPELGTDVSDLPLVRGFKVAYIVFKSQEALNKALKLTHLKPLSTKEVPIVTGLRKWIREYNESVDGTEKLIERAKAGLAEYYKKEEEEKANKDQNTEDDDGWTVVTKKTRQPGLTRKESVQKNISKKSILKTRRKELKNFYTFQMREEKMKTLMELRKKDEENKKKINTIKQMRKYKPY